MTIRPRGPLPDWEPSTPRQQGVLADLVARYKQHKREGTLPRGPRGIFYDLRPNGTGNGITYRKPDSLHPISGFDRDTEAHPAAVQEVLVLARRAGKIPEHWVADERAPDAHVPYADESAEEVANSIASQIQNAERSFNLDRQLFQPCYVEVLCEAGDLIPRISRIVRNDFGVPVYSGAGFDGLKGKREFAQRAVDREVPTFVLNVGDRDKHGEDIFVAAAEDAVAWAKAWGVEGHVEPLGIERDADGGEAERLRERLRELREEREGSPALVFVRLALTEEQAREHELLDADGKAEVDGLPVPVLDALLLDAVDTLHDPSCRERMLAEEESERQRLAAAIRAALDR